MGNFRYTPKWSELEPELLEVLAHDHDEETSPKVDELVAKLQQRDQELEDYLARLRPGVPPTPPSGGSSVYPSNLSSYCFAQDVANPYGFSLFPAGASSGVILMDYPADFNDANGDFELIDNTHGTAQYIHILKDGFYRVAFEAQLIIPTTVQAPNTWCALSVYLNLTPTPLGGTSFQAISTGSPAIDLFADGNSPWFADASLNEFPSQSWTTLVSHAKAGDKLWWNWNANVVGAFWGFDGAYSWAGIERVG
jgi:hypothetical protein